MADELNGRIQEVEKSLGALDAQMRDQVNRIQSSTRTILVVGIILIAIIFGYLTYLTSKIKEELEPPRLAETMAGLASGQIPALEASLKEQAPEVIKGLREEAVAQIPVLREYAETKALELVDMLGDKLEGKVDSLVDELLKGHHAELKPLIEAAAAPGNAQKLEEAFQESLEDLVGPKMDEVLKEFDQAMAAIEAKLDRLLEDDSKLMPEEKLEKELVTALMIFLDDTTKEQLGGAPRAPAPMTPPPAPAPAPAPAPKAPAPAPAR